MRAWLTISQAAALASVDRSTINRWIAKRRLRQVVTVRGHRYVPAKEVLRVKKAMRAARRRGRPGARVRVRLVDPQAHLSGDDG